MGQHKHTSFMSLQSAGHAPPVFAQTGFSSLPHVSATDENDDIALIVFLTAMMMMMMIVVKVMTTVLKICSWSKYNEYDCQVETFPNGTKSVPIERGQ